MDNYTNVDFKKNELTKVAIESLDIAPLDPVVGQTYFDLTLKALRTWNGQEWISTADLPIASDTVLGAIKVGKRLSIDEEGFLSADIQTDNNLTDELRDAILNIGTTIQQHNTDVTAHQYILGLITQEVYDRTAGDSTLTGMITDEIQRALTSETNIINTKEDKANKTQTITNTSTSDQYPSARATYLALNKKLDANVAISPSSEYRVVRYDEKGLVTDGRKIIDADITPGIDATKIANGSITNENFETLFGIKDNIQNQIDTLDDKKANKINGTEDLKDVKDTLEKEINDINTIIGKKEFKEPIVDRINTISTIPTVMQADKDNYVVSQINIISPGTKYKLKERFELGAFGLPVVVSAIDVNGGITQLSWSNDTTFSSDLAETDLGPLGYEGEGTGATFTILTRYADGNQVVRGDLLNVPEEDPLVQFTRMKGFVEAEIASQMQLSILGYISTSDPSTKLGSIAIGSMWVQDSSTSEPKTNFPWNVRTWNGSSWSSDYISYTPNFNDIWSNLNVTDPLTSSGYYWFDTKWVPYGFSFNPDYFVHTVSNQTINGVKTFTNTIVGNIDTADKLKTPRTINLDGMVSGDTTFDGSENVTIITSINNDTITRDMLQKGIVNSSKIADTSISDLVKGYNKTKYIVGDSNSYENWLNSLTAKVNYLLDNKNKVFIQTSIPTPNNVGDIWIQTVSE